MVSQIHPLNGCLQSFLLVFSVFHQKVSNWEFVIASIIIIIAIVVHLCCVFTITNIQTNTVGNVRMY